MSRLPGEAQWLSGALQGGSSHWVENACGAIHSVDLAGRRIPVQLAEDGACQSYVASLISAWVRYPAFEASRRFSAFPPSTLGRLAAPLSALLRAGGLHRAALLGNWMVSTNLHPVASGRDWNNARDEAIVLAGQRPLALRSVCPEVDGGIDARLEAEGWLLVPARLVYLCDPGNPEVWKRNHVRKDRRLLDDPAFSIAGPGDIAADDLPQLRRLFRDVFIDKHSPLNPDFSAAFFALCREHRFLDLFALRLNGETVGVLALLERHGWLTTPLIGHDTGKPQSLALYRRLMALLLAESLRRKTRLHYSSGAGDFKRARGGMPALEYTALYVRHLPKRQLRAAAVFAALCRRFARPILLRYG
jgi:Acetyltransferase (GNAT) domain